MGPDAVAAALDKATARIDTLLAVNDIAAAAYAA
jgi:hypothetical protein